MKAFALQIVFAVACSSSSPDATPPNEQAVQGHCARAIGFYRVTFKTRDGNCGAISERLTNLTSDTAPGAGCTGPGDSYSTNGCTVVSDQSCTKDGSTSRFVGKVTWNVDASRGEGLVQLSTSGNAGTCTGTYDVLFIRQ